MLNNKIVRLVKTITATATGTYAVLTGEGGVLSEYAKMDVIGVVNTLVGTGVMNLIIKESVPSSAANNITYVNTAMSGIINSAQTGGGYFFLDYLDNNASGSYASPSTKLNPMLGKGMVKNITASITGPISDLNMDVIFVFYKD